MFFEPRLVDLSDPRIAIPWGSGIDKLDQDTDVWLYQLPSPNGGQGPISEIIITPIRNTLWRDIWNIDLTLKERRGTYHRMTKLLSSLGINILLEHSASSNHGQYHTSRFVTDCHGYNSPFDLSSDERSLQGRMGLQGLWRRLVLEFIDELIIVRPRTPSLEISRNFHLLQLHQRSGQSATYPQVRKPGIDHGTIAIPQSMIDNIRASHARKYRLGLDAIPSPIGLPILDQASDLMQVFVFVRGDGILPVAVRLLNQPGAIAAATTILYEHHFTVIASKAWTSQDLEYTDLWLLVADQSLDVFPVEEEAIIDKLEGAFVCPSPARDMYRAQINRVHRHEP